MSTSIAPALCLASRQLWQEALPLFLQSCTVQIEIPVYPEGVPRVPYGLVTGLYGLTHDIPNLAALSYGIDPDSPGASPFLQQQFQLRLSTYSLLSNATEYMLTKVRRFELHGLVFTGDHAVDTKWVLSVKKGDVYLSEGAMTNNGPEPEDFRPACEKVEQRMRERTVENTKLISS